MYRHLLAPIDCTDEARRAALQLVRHFASVPACRVTLAATISPSPSPEIRHKKVRHARAALDGIGEILHGYGVYTTRRILEGADAAAALADEARSPGEVYDVIVLGAYQTRPDEEDEAPPCRGSLADRICRRTHVPVVVLPAPAAGAPTA